MNSAPAARASNGKSRALHHPFPRCLRLFNPYFRHVRLFCCLSASRSRRGRSTSAPTVIRRNAARLNVSPPGGGVEGPRARVRAGVHAREASP